MMSLATIHILNAQVTARAAKVNKVPFILAEESEIDSFPPIPFPNLGNHCPNGWEQLEETFFVDLTGMGGPGELALTCEQFKDALRQSFSENPQRGYGIVEKGEFQLHVGIFVKEDTA